MTNYYIIDETPDIQCILSIAPTTKPRKLKARWSVDAAEDLKAYSAMDELSRHLADIVAREIDEEILSCLFNKK